MILFNSQNFSSNLPENYSLSRGQDVSLQALNRLLSKCNSDTHQPKKLDLALKNSDFYLTILQVKLNNLVGFVRVTSDKGLNANLWDLVAEPGDLQETFITVLVYKAIEIIRREMPGCSISIAAPTIAIQALKDNGFLLDPNGIRTMGFKL